MFDRWGRCLVAWLAACSLLVSSTAAIVHTHEHAGHEHSSCTAHAQPIESHVGCRHHHHAKPASKSEAPTHQHPPLPYSHDDCSLCHFLLEHSLSPSIVELPLLDVVLELRPETPRIVEVSARFERPLVRGPPALA